MYCLTVIYQKPENPEHFKKHYAEVHLPLAKKLPGLRTYNVAYPTALGRQEGAPFCIFQAYFDDLDGMNKALRSDVGKEVASDVPNYSPKGASMFHFDLDP